jgi:predicted nucleic acid-binding protein
MPKLIISDTSCLLLLNAIEELHLLGKLYSQVYITAEVSEEFEYPLPNWIIVLNPENLLLQQTLLLQVDKGEASAIALALEHPQSTLILDDLKARKLAARLKLNFTGTIGIIIKAKQIGVIVEVKPILLKIAQTDFRISESIIHEALKLAGEI